MIFIVSDEAYFTLTQPLNKQNIRIWADWQPAIGIETSLHDEKVLFGVFSNFEKTLSLVLNADGGHIKINKALNLF